MASGNLDPADQIFGATFATALLQRCSVLNAELEKPASTEAIVALMAQVTRQAVAELRHADPGRADELLAELDEHLEAIRLRYQPAGTAH